MSYLQDLEDEVVGEYMDMKLSSVLGVGTDRMGKPRVCPKCGRLVSYEKVDMTCDHGDYVAKYQTWHCDFCLDEVLPHIECCPACRIERALSDTRKELKELQEDLMF